MASSWPEEGQSFLVEDHLGTFGGDFAREALQISQVPGLDDLLNGHGVVSALPDIFEGF